MASGSNDKTVRVWGNDVCLLKLQGHTATVTCLAVPSGVGASLASCSKDKTVRIWCNGRCLRILRGHTAAVTCLAVLADRFLVSAGEDGTLRWWKSTSSSCLHTINGVATDVTCVLPSSLPHSLFTVGATSGTLIQVEDGVVLGTTQLQAGLSCLALMPDGKGCADFEMTGERCSYGALMATQSSPRCTSHLCILCQSERQKTHTLLWYIHDMRSCIHGPSIILQCM